LVINTDRMRLNLEYTGGLFFSEGVMLALVRKGMARQAAYELVQRNALAVADGLTEMGTLKGFPNPPAMGPAGQSPSGSHASKPDAGAPSFRQRLGRDADIASKLSAEELDRAFDLQHHLRWTGEVINRALRDGGN
jgi:adenylosuccinate lyase